MAIRIQCTCGRTIQAADTAAGRRLKCPACGRLVTVPAPPSAPSPRVAGLMSPRERRQREHEEAMQTFGMAKAFAWSFVYPFTGSGKWMMLLIPIIVIPLAFVPCVGWLLVIGMYYGWIIQVIRGASFGPAGELVWGDLSFWGERVWPGLKIVANAIVILIVPTLVTKSWLQGVEVEAGVSPLTVLLTSPPILMMWIAFALYYVMSYTIVTTYGEFFASLNPVIVLTSIARIPGEFALVWMFSMAMYFLSDLALTPLASVSWVAANILRPFFNLYVICVIVSRLGFMAYRNRYRLAWG